MLEEFAGRKNMRVLIGDQGPFTSVMKTAEGPRFVGTTVETIRRVEQLRMLKPALVKNGLRLVVEHEAMHNTPEEEGVRKRIEDLSRRAWDERIAELHGRARPGSARELPSERLRWIAWEGRANRAMVSAVLQELGVGSVSRVAGNPALHEKFVGRLSDAVAFICLLNPPYLQVSDLQWQEHRFPTLPKDLAREVHLLAAKKVREVHDFEERK
jgi:hypothetical protein